MAQHNPPSLWARYVSDLLGDQAPNFIEYDWGFISFSFPKERPGTLFCENIYVSPERQGGNSALGLLAEAEAVGKKLGCTEVMFVVRIDSPTCAANLRIYLAMGFVPNVAHNGSIFLVRKIKAGG